MDRPLSAASSNASRPAATHKRNASIKTTTKPNGPSTLQLFLTNLRLLNLDLLQDSPDLVQSSFATLDARLRIRSTEYALYQLFRLYDPRTTADKLQPFFPPLEPLQSVNLRAALFRCLNELKRNGALPKETVFRKSMLDDCQGDKFWEACLSFSAVVVRANTLERKAKYGQPIAEKLGTAQGLSKRSRESMLPLALAHKAALTKILKERETRRESCATIRIALCEKEVELRERKAVSSRASEGIRTIPHDKSRALENAINRNWVGSVALKDALIEGDTCAAGDGILVEDFDHLWFQNGAQELAVSNGADAGLLQSLSSRATQQSVRLRMWQNYLDRMVASRPKSRGSISSAASQKSTIRFDKHRNINLRATVSDEDEAERKEPPLPPTPPERRHVSASCYDEILTAMREELRQNMGQRSVSQPTRPAFISPLKRAQTQPMSKRQASISLDTATGVQDSHSRSPSLTAVPVRPRMGRRVSSQSKTYEKPKVESQREPIPLKSELFSPLKENRQSVQSFAAVVPGLSVAIEEPETPDVKIGKPFTKGSRHSIRLRDDIDSGVDLRSENDARESETNTLSSARSSASADDLTVISEFQQIPHLSSQEPIVRPSLIERTRMSIAYNSAEDIHPVLHRPKDASIDPIDRESKTIEPASPALETSTTVPRASLLERTRESILQAPTPDLPKKSSHTRSRSSLHPVNQFETPRKTRSSTIGAHNGGKRNVTPIEQLWSPDAEYESVFKARPKIAWSPILSPRGDGDDVLERSTLVADADSPLGIVEPRTMKAYN